MSLSESLLDSDAPRFIEDVAIFGFWFVKAERLCLETGWKGQE